MDSPPSHHVFWELRLLVLKVAVVWASRAGSNWRILLPGEGPLPLRWNRFDLSVFLSKDFLGHCEDWIYLTQPPFGPSLQFLSHGQFRISSTVGLTSPSTTWESDGLGSSFNGLNIWVWCSCWKWEENPGREFCIVYPALYQGSEQWARSSLKAQTAYITGAW